MSFPQRLIELRKYKKLTQEELAKQIGSTRSALSLWELGLREPDQETLQRFADFFGVSTDYLLGRDNNTPPPNQKPKKLYDVIARAEDLPEENLDQVVDALEALIKHHEEKMKNKRKTK